MSDGEEETKQGFKISDRRRFDAEGDERSDAPAESAASESAAGPKSSRAQARPAPTGGKPVISFSAFLMSLATQALMQLGEMKPPEGVNIPVDLEGARHAIEILEMLYLKTKGNVTDEEARLLEEILHNLRISFVRRSDVKK